MHLVGFTVEMYNITMQGHMNGKFEERNLIKTFYFPKITSHK